MKGTIGHSTLTYHEIKSIEIEEDLNARPITDDEEFVSYPPSPFHLTKRTIIASMPNSGHFMIISDNNILTNYRAIHQRKLLANQWQGEYLLIYLLRIFKNRIKTSTITNRCYQCLSCMNKLKYKYYK